MLFKVNHLRGIKNGDISLAFRKCKSARVRNGSIIKTAVGQIGILEINQIDRSEIKEKDAINAGHKSLEELLKLLDVRKDGNIFRIRLKYHSEDPRIALREQTGLTDDEIGQIRIKLEGFDKFSKQGHWTYETLKAINDNPGLRAQGLADLTGRQKDWLKPNVRKLKNLGLTISHEVGYSLSPRGKIILGKLSQEE